LYFLINRVFWDLEYDTIHILAAVIVYATDWDWWMAAVLYVIRTSNKRDHGYSPFFLVYGRNPRSFTEDELWNWETELVEEGNVLARIQELIVLNRAIIPNARQNMLIYNMKMVKRYNQKAKTKKFRVGDMVLVEKRPITEHGVELLPRWLGPVHVKEIVRPDVYRVRDGDLELPSVFHGNQMKLHKRRPRLGVELSFYSKFRT
jgi:hypothetical protein